MKLIVRADDFGYTKTYNDGVIKAIEEGIVTHVDLMFDTPGTKDALTRIQNYPWISVGWHSHFWGKPVLPAEEVPSMVDEKGNFKFRKDQKLKNTCSYGEVLKESRAQMELCLAYLGRVPDCASIQNELNDFEKARLQVCKEYHIPCNIADKPNAQGELVLAYEPYRSLGIFMPNQPATIYKQCYSDSVQIRKSYNPVQYYIADEGHLLDKKIALTAWHPGFLDDYILKESSMTECRVMDVIALCSEELKQWIIDKKVELINTKDALYQTGEYQNHLKQIKSKLELNDN